MFCKKCGSPNDDNALQCTSCGENLQDTPQPIPAGGANVPTRLVPAILVTLFCCLPFGIVSIVYAAQVSGKVASGDITGAWECSRKAKMWCWLAFGLGLAAQLLWLIIAVIGGIAGAASEM